MVRIRIIPCLLLMNGRLVKTIKFKHPTYVGDPINIVRIFNAKEVDELLFLDISATPNNRGPQFKLIKEIASECCMPFAYGGGISTFEEVQMLFKLGLEKIVLNTIAFKDKNFVNKVAEHYGNQSIIVSIDVKKNLLGKYKVFTHCGYEKTSLDPVDYAQEMEARGAGEILLTAINHDGTMSGYDTDLIKRVTQAVNIPVIACGGAGEMTDFVKAVKHSGASAAAAGSMVVFQGKNRAILTNFPKRDELKQLFAS